MKPFPLQLEGVKDTMAPSASVKSAGEARVVPKSRPHAVSAAHRRRVTQPPQAAAPTTANGLMRARTTVSVAPSSAHIASAMPIAQAV